MIYLDNNASTRVDEGVLEAMLPWFRDNWANPANTRHHEGKKALAAVVKARAQIANLLRCESDEVIFTGGASESNALAILGARPAGAAPVGVVTSSIEHPSTFALAARLKALGIPLRLVDPNPRGFISIDCIPPHIANGTLVSFEWVNSESGAINEIADITRHVKAAGGLIHVDAAQALGKLPIALDDCPIDLLTISAHKVHGPKGIGALFVRKGVRIDPLIVGGRQENGLRAGTVNVPGAVGFGAACELIDREADLQVPTIKSLRDLFERKIVAMCPDTVVVGGKATRACNTSFLGWAGLESREILRALDAVGICAGAGTACSTEDPFGSRALRAMNVPQSVIPSCVRFGFSKDNSLADAEAAAQETARIVTELRKP